MSVLIPAYREADRIGETVRALGAALTERLPGGFELVVIDDGSDDGTAEAAAGAGARVIRLARNRGKGGALLAGLAGTSGNVLLLLDADLGASARDAVLLLEPVLAGQAEMTVATFPPDPAGNGEKGRKGGGFGFVVRLARWGLRAAGAVPMRAPLSGQRAMTRAAWERIGRLDPGFGIEMGLNLDAHRAGLRVLEVPTNMAHRVTGRDWAGFRHRGRQFRDVLLAILRRLPAARRRRA